MLTKFELMANLSIALENNNIFELFIYGSIGQFCSPALRPFFTNKIHCRVLEVNSYKAETQVTIE